MHIIPDIATHKHRTLPARRVYLTLPTICVYGYIVETFRAVVEWHPIALDRDVKRIYRIVFSVDCICIEKGEVISYGASGETRHMWTYGQELV